MCCLKATKSCKLSNKSEDSFKQRQITNNCMETVQVLKKKPSVDELRDDVLLQLKMALEDIKAGRVKRVR